MLYFKFTSIITVNYLVRTTYSPLNVNLTIRYVPGTKYNQILPIISNT